MAETSRRQPELEIVLPRRRSPDGADRCYVRLALLGDGASWRANGLGASRWPRLLAEALGTAHDLSWWDARSAGATAYDVRRVQLRSAVVHRPHLVALTTGLIDARRREWDPAETRSHLLHCAQVLTRQGVLLLTTALDPWWPRLLAGGHPALLRSRIDQLNGLYDELHERFGTIHLLVAPRAGSLPPPDEAGVRALPGAAGLTARFAHELARRGLEFPGAR